MTTKADLLRAIRRKCLDCSCYQPTEVQLCPVTACDLWLYRFGRDPNPSQTRGFAKPHVYTNDSEADEADGHSPEPTFPVDAQGEGAG